MQSPSLSPRSILFSSPRVSCASPLRQQAEVVQVTSLQVPQQAQQAGPLGRSVSPSRQVAPLAGIVAYLGEPAAQSVLSEGSKASVSSALTQATSSGATTVGYQQNSAALDGPPLHLPDCTWQAKAAELDDLMSPIEGKTRMPEIDDSVQQARMQERQEAAHAQVVHDLQMAFAQELKHITEMLRGELATSHSEIMRVLEGERRHRSIQMDDFDRRLQAEQENFDQMAGAVLEKQAREGDGCQDAEATITGKWGQQQIQLLKLEADLKNLQSGQAEILKDFASLQEKLRLEEKASNEAHLTQQAIVQSIGDFGKGVEEISATIVGIEAKLQREIGHVKKECEERLQRTVGEAVEETLQKLKSGQVSARQQLEELIKRKFEQILDISEESNRNVARALVNEHETQGQQTAALGVAVADLSEQLSGLRLPENQLAITALSAEVTLLRKMLDETRQDVNSLSGIVPAVEKRCENDVFSAEADGTGFVGGRKEAHLERIELQQATQEFKAHRGCLEEWQMHMEEGEQVAPGDREHRWDAAVRSSTIAPSTQLSIAMDIREAKDMLLPLPGRTESQGMASALAKALPLQGALSKAQPLGPVRAAFAALNAQKGSHSDGALG